MSEFFESQEVWEDSWALGWKAEVSLYCGISGGEALEVTDWFCVCS